jgi:hypothetical protein
MAYYNGCSFGKARELNEERRMQNQERRQEKLDAIGGTLEEQEKFKQDLVHYFNDNKMKDAFHYIVKEEFMSHFLDACLLLKCKMSKYHCKCETLDDKLHRHLIVFLPNPTNVKKPSQKLARMLSVVMSKKNVTMGENRRVSFGIKIKSRVHLLNVVLYIQTERTQGQHSGMLKKCLHFGHWTKTVIPDRQTLQIFREDELDVLLPEFAKERREYWLKYKKNSKVEKMMEEFKNQNQAEKFNEMIE